MFLGPGQRFHFPPDPELPLFILPFHAFPLVGGGLLPCQPLLFLLPLPLRLQPPLLLLQLQVFQSI